MKAWVGWGLPAEAHGYPHEGAGGVGVPAEAYGYPCEGAGGVVEPPALPGPAPVVVVSDLLRRIVIPGPLFDACVREGAFVETGASTIPP